MNNPDEVLKAQRELSVLDGTKKVTLWLMLSLVALTVVGVVIAVNEKSSIMATLQTAFLILSACAMTRAACINRKRELESSLLPEKA